MMRKIALLPPPLAIDQEPINQQDIVSLLRAQDAKLVGLPHYFTILAKLYDPVALLCGC